MIEWVKCGPMRAGMVKGRIEVMVEPVKGDGAELRTPWNGTTIHPTILEAQEEAQRLFQQTRN